MSYMIESGVTRWTTTRRKARLLPSGCGVAVAFGFAVGLLTYVFGSSFSFYTAIAILEYLFATVIAVFFIAFVGLPG